MADENRKIEECGGVAGFDASEREIAEILRSEMADVEVPESLAPEEIRKKLKEIDHKNGSGQTVKAAASGKNRRGRLFAIAGTMAAALVLVAGLSVMKLRSTIVESGSSYGAASNKAEFTAEIPTAKSYDEVYDYVKKATETTNSGISLFKMGRSNEVMEEAAVADSIASAEAKSVGTSDASYSDTNVRTEGIGEADVVKTDGTYIYALENNMTKIAIIKAVDGKMEEITKVTAPDNMAVSEFYVDGTNLYILGVRESADSPQDTFLEETALATFDVSSIENPKLIGTVGQSGFYQSSRFVDGYIYMFSNYQVFYWGNNFKSGDKEYYIPRANGKYIAEGCIYLPQEKTADQYIVVSSVNTKNPDKLEDTKAVLSSNGQIYVSADSIFVYDYNNYSFLRNGADLSDDTVIRKLSFSRGEISGVAQGKVEGYINDSFSIDEYDGYLRVVTTVGSGDTSENRVYVFDGELEQVACIEDIAEGEIVYSARFMGEVGYFVTYRNMDPLFSVDFSNPTEPKIIGALKIPGFSEYLHPYGDGLLLGIGMDTDEKSGVTNGIKLSMFDISDPSDVKEVAKYTIKDVYYADLFNEYKACLVEPKRDLIGFSAYGKCLSYYVFNYDSAKGFTLRLEEDVKGIQSSQTRGVRIDEVLYVINSGTAESYSLMDYHKIDDLLH